MSTFVGIDVAKAAFVVAVRDENGDLIVEHRRFETDEIGLKKFVGFLGDLEVKQGQVHLAVEASGNLHLNLISYLLEATPDILIYALNPLMVKRCAGVQLHRNHTDPADAKHVAWVLAHGWQNLHPWQHSPFVDRLRCLVHQRDRLIDDRIRGQNRLHALLNISFPEFTRVFRDPATPLALHLLHQNPTATHFVRRQRPALAKQRPQGNGRHALGSQRADALITLAKHSVASACSQEDAMSLRMTVEQLQLLQRHILQIDQRICSFFTEPNPATTSDQNTAPLPDDTDHKLRHELQLITSVPGIGIITGAAIMSRALDIAQFESADAFSAFIGTCPHRFQTGTSRDTATLTSYAHRPTRAHLYMGTQSAIQSFLPLRFYFQRHLNNGLKYKQALAACMNRLIHWAYGVVKNDTPFNPQKIIDTCRHEFPDEWNHFCLQHKTLY